MNIKRLVNSPVSSNCFILYDGVGTNLPCVIIDPGSENNDDLLNFISHNKLNPEFIILTHEHFDHCWGVNGLRKRYPYIKLVCAYECSDAIQSSKGNCSVFYDNIKAFEIVEADVVIDKDVHLMSCGNLNIMILRTPGHSKGSISMVVNNVIFTGDALIPGIKTVIKLPSASIDEQIKSESFFKTLEGYIIYPGHETPVKFDTALFKWYSK